MKNNNIQEAIWAICNDIRDGSSLNMSNAQPYMLGFMFYKFLSEKIHQTCTTLLKGRTTYEDLTKDIDKLKRVKDACIEKIGYFIEYKDSYKSVLIDALNNNGVLADRLSIAFKNIEDSTIGKNSSKDFKGLFDNVNLNSNNLGENSEKMKETLLYMLKSLDKKELIFDGVNNDVLGDAYEFLIGKFASESGQKAGEFYTPAPVSTLLSKIATYKIEQAQYVYDPTCGSASLLIKVVKELKKFGSLLGQEKSTETFNLARMNMFLHGIKYKDFRIENGNTLTDNKFSNLSNKIDIIIANPPFSTSWQPHEMDDDPRFSEYPKMAPKSTADFAFVQHMIYMLKPGGRLAVVVPHGVLFRGNAEGSIRKYLVEHKKYLRAVIGLPSNMFFNAAIPTCILVFEKNEKNDSVLFIDASKEFVKNKNKNTMTEHNIKKILDIYSKPKEVDKFSRLVSLKEIEENEYNLNITRYIDTTEPEEEIDIALVNQELKILDIELLKLEKEIQEMILELKEVK